MDDGPTPRVPEHLYAQQPRSAAGLAAIAGLQALSESAHNADEQAVCALQMRPLDALALLHLVQSAREGRPMSATRLARTIGLSSPAVTKLIDRIVDTGRAERQPNPKDRRGIVVIPTGTAVEDIALAYAHIHAPLVEVIDELSDEEAMTIARFSTRLAGALRSSNPPRLPAQRTARRTIRRGLR
ncbi:MarR family transcriptional regulator [Curtobacterium sp. ISL-83]|uniref:MarR family transcriptional regulator n=1 Tax=Curtobacterium sp. ISL-83 TaxID=2819145 RepID=UPI001BEAFA25|nr:MarR family transcriptional regulator [Curtobacterium sp. ISL-83]MBT2504083.1 MarR family transcriptional regulator [Curtobacterium sp. ISL-83]